MQKDTPISYQQFLYLSVKVSKPLLFTTSLILIFLQIVMKVKYQQKIHWTFHCLFKAKLKIPPLISKYSNPSLKNHFLGSLKIYSQLLMKAQKTLFQPNHSLIFSSREEFPVFAKFGVITTALQAQKTIRARKKRK